MGRVVHSPELRMTNGGVNVCKFTLAVDRDRRDADGNRGTDFIDVVTFKEKAEFVAAYFMKGRMVYADGRLQSRKWQDRSGNNRIAWEVIADQVGFGGKEEQTEERQERPADSLPDPSIGQYAKPASAQAAFDELEEEGSEDRVPF